MAELKMAKEKAEKTVSDKLSEFVSKWGKVLLGVTVAVVVAIVIYAVLTATNAKNTQNGLASIDTITHELTDGSAYLEETELEARRVKAMDSLSEHLSKSSVVGVRANMLAADIAFERKNYAEAKGYWEQAAAKDSRAYTAPLAYYNIGVCQEELGDISAAAVSYEKAADANEFTLAAHARFSAGRVKEAAGDYSGAYDTYQKLVDVSPDDTWANLAKSRQIALRAEGKVSR